MSSSSAGKFQDHYVVLGVEPKADLETIQQAYGKLAQKFHPSNAETGDKEKFDSVNQAYEILSDISLRREFDKLKGIGGEEGAPKFSGVQFFDSLGRGTGLRLALMCILYDRRREHPFTPSVSMRHLEGMVEGTSEDLNFALWYLKQKSLVVADDKSSLQITVDGMDYLETNRPSAEVVMPFIKGVASVTPSPKPAVPSAPADELKPGISVLRRALARK